jgi:hypothetical protein
MAKITIKIPVTLSFDGDIEDARRMGIDFAEEFILRRTKNYTANFGDYTPLVQYDEPTVIVDGKPQEEPAPEAG